MGRFLLCVLVSACGLWACGEGEDDDTPEGATTFTLTAAGGTFVGTGPLAGVELVVPADAVDGALDLWMVLPDADRPLPDTGRFVGPEVQFGPADVDLARTAELTLPFSPDRAIDEGAEIRFVKVWRVGPDGWELAEPLNAPDAERVSAEIDILSRFGAGVEVE